MTKLDALDALAQAATPGPWHAQCRDVSNQDNKLPWDREHFLQWDLYGPETPSGRGEFYGEDAVYLAALSPELVRALVACVRAADTLVATLNNGHWKALAEYQSARAALDALLPEPPK